MKFSWKSKNTNGERPIQKWARKSISRNVDSTVTNMFKVVPCRTKQSIMLCAR